MPISVVSFVTLSPSSASGFTNSCMSSRMPSSSTNAAIFLPNFFSFRAVVAKHLAAQQVQRLDGVGAFVDHVDARVAHVLLHAPLVDVAVSAVHLHAMRGGDPAVVAHEGLDDGRQQRHLVGAFPAHVGVGFCGNAFTSLPGITSAMSVGCFCASSRTTGFAPVSVQGRGGDMSSIAANAETPRPNTAIEPAANATR